MAKHKRLIIEVLPYFKSDAQFQTPRTGEMGAIDLNRLALTMKDRLAEESRARCVRTRDAVELIDDAIKGCGGIKSFINACF